MKKKLLIYGPVLCCLFMMMSCRKNHEPAIDENTTTPVGTPDGIATAKFIDAAGGTLSSTDGCLTIIIPAGALGAGQEISIQPITNQLPSGIGKAYRIAPHGVQFNKPVTLEFRYKAEDLANTLPEFLDVAYQDAMGSWQALHNISVDKVNRKIAVSTTHFSDWTYFKSLKLEPADATVEPGGAVDLKVTTTFPFLDPDDDPTGNTTPVYTKPRLLRPDEIKGWHLAGDGILVSRGPEAYYTAPEETPDANPQAVSVEINLHRKGQFLLVASITVLADRDVDYLQVDEDYLSPLNKGKCSLYLYGSFGNDPGASKRSVTINSKPVEVYLWAPGVIVCRIDREIYGAIEIKSNNKVVAGTVLRRFSGSFLYERFHGGVANAGSSNPLKEVTQFDLVYRGFGKPCPSGVNLIYNGDLGLAEGTQARYTFSGSATVSTPPQNGCIQTASVSLPTTSGLQPMNPLSVNSFSRFKVYVKDVQDGIEVKIDYTLDNAITGVKVKRSSTCGPSTTDSDRTLQATFAGFQNSVIGLEFKGTSGLQLKGTQELKSNRLTTGILTEAWDGTGNPSHYETDGMVPATFRNL